MLKWWYGLMAGGGFAFGLFANRRPLGEGILVHPLVLFFAVVALALLTLRAVYARPVPELISDRALMYGCCAGLLFFLVGNFLAVFAFGAR
ncbi:MAG TPA: hypothetical protein VMH84_15015 [Xanthobacteraceae bacterium]|nr:hypothetical protein [Xanthobacteraceae bacterium]